MTMKYIAIKKKKKMGGLMLIPQTKAFSIFEWLFFLSRWKF